MNSNIQTYSGKMFNVFDPDASLIDIEDIAHALSLTCRFGGHCSSFYSVAQHSILVSDWMYKNLHPQKSAIIGMIGLLHDAAEAYIGDVPRPIKRFINDFDKIEFNIIEMIYKKYGVWNFYKKGNSRRLSTVKFSHNLQFADDTVLSTEKRDLMKSEVKGWQKLPPPCSKRIRTWNPQEAEKKFINRFNKYWEIIND